MDSVFAFMEKKAGSIPPEAKARVLANDPQALLVVVNGLGEWLSKLYLGREENPERRCCKSTRSSERGLRKKVNSGSNRTT